MSPISQFSSSDMASDTASSALGSPGLSVRYDEHNHQQRHNRKLEEPSKESEIEQLRRELEDSRQRIERDTGLINNLYEKLTELEELVKKQKITISTQSRTISDRRVLRKNQQQQQQSQSQSPMYPMTPSHHHHVHQCQYPGSGASGVSCSSTGTCVGGGLCAMHNNSAASPFETQVPAQAQTPLSVKSLDPTSSQCGTVFDQPPPKFEIPMGAPHSTHNFLAPPGTVKRKESIDIFSHMASSATTGTAHALSASPPGVLDLHKEMGDFSARFQALMRMSEVFGQTHASFPNIYNDSHMDNRVKDYLMAMSSGSRTSHLLEDAATRGFLVAKAINWYITEKILKVDVVMGFDASVDSEIKQIQDQIKASAAGLLQGIPLIRHLMLTAITTHVSSLSKHPAFAEFTTQQITHHLTELWPYIAPLGHDTHQNSHSHSPNSMWTDFHSIVSEAHALAIDMFSVPLEYRFEYPEAEPFDPLTMINRDPYVHCDPQLLKNSPETRVRLGVTPIVRIRDSSGGAANVHLMYLGHVLLKQPPKKQGSVV
ncbi:uncharacterized protein BDV17DRAFT_8667 [Aspergillus undulatus]|uniref:uncharacterized protein n=1 Tax=Aspergillus undulatus TaxID=1810928 RepID=UPI003CCCBEFD